MTHLVQIITIFYLSLFTELCFPFVLMYQSKHHLHEKEKQYSKKICYLDDGIRTYETLPSRINDDRRDRDESTVDYLIRSIFQDKTSCASLSMFHSVRLILRRFIMDNYNKQHVHSNRVQNINIQSPLLIKDSEKSNRMKQEECVHLSPYDSLFDILYNSSSLDFQVTNTTTNMAHDHLCDLDLQHRRIHSKQRKVISFKIRMSYQGSNFGGWQIQPNNHQLPSVQQTLVDILQPVLLLNNSKVNTQNTNKIKKDNKEPSVDIRVCGRTDAGVSALSQICRVRTLDKTIKPMDIQNAINMAALGNNTSPLTEHSESFPSFWCTSVEKVDDKFHPTFDATCRAYLYLIDVKPFIGTLESSLKGMCQNDFGYEILEHITISPQRLAQIINQMLNQLEDKTLDYYAVSYGPIKSETTLCTLFRARASIMQVRKNEILDDDKNIKPIKEMEEVISIELVGDRFLRRMVRVLVATAIREAVEEYITQKFSSLAINSSVRDDSGSHSAATDNEKGWDYRLLRLIRQGDRLLSAKAAPPDGLIFVDARFGNS